MAGGRDPVDVELTAGTSDPVVLEVVDTGAVDGRENKQTQNVYLFINEMNM